MAARAVCALVAPDRPYSTGSAARIARSSNAGGTDRVATRTPDRSGDGSERSRQPSAANLISEPWRRGNDQYAREIRGVARNPDAGFRIRTRHRLRQCRESHAGARYRAAARDIVE